MEIWWDGIITNLAHPNFNLTCSTVDAFVIRRYHVVPIRFYKFGFYIFTPNLILRLQTLINSMDKTYNWTAGVHN